MSIHHQPGHHEKTVDHWLEEHQTSLMRTLDTTLDVEAGLREALLPSACMHARLRVGESSEKS